jgi:4-amino-4-deoxy-L-arabinose transferase-like glycosyltransferase
MSMRWDEVTHLNGGMFLLRGNFQSYLGSSAFYPPMYDLFMAGIFSVAGISMFTGRLVSMAFSLLTLCIVFELGSKMYGAKTALIATVLLGVMPGYLWLSHVAMIETMLVFFFTTSSLLFFCWLRLQQDKFLILSGLTLGLGILVKYQMAILVVIMLSSLVVLGRKYLKKKFTRFLLLILVAFVAVIPWILVSYQLYASGMLNQWLYAINIGNPEKILYDTGLNRFPLLFSQLPSWLQPSVFYLFELTVPYPDVHPVSFFLFVLGFAGLIGFGLRRKAQDKCLLVWFFAVYIFFSSIPNREWRYMIPIFPVLSLSAANLLTSTLGKARSFYRNKQLRFSRQRLAQMAAGLLIIFTVVGAVYSVSNDYSWVSKEQVNVPIQEATDYAVHHMSPSQSVLVLCASNLFCEDMVKFYLYSNSSTCNKVFQYPTLPIDVFRPDFEVNQLSALCQKNNVKCVLLYEYGATFPYFNSTLNTHEIFLMLLDSGNFTCEATLKGSPGCSITIFFFTKAA